MENFDVARIRTIKPEFWSDEQVMSCSIHARLLFIGLWNFCDDSGVHPLKPVSLKALIFPGDSIDSTSIRRLLLELSENDLIALYDVDGKQYLQVLGWAHQRIDKPTRKYPTHENGIPIKTDTYQLKFEESSKNTRGVVVEDSDTERKGIDQDQKHLVKFDQKSAFDIFWKLYPRKVSKAPAEKKFMTKCKDAETFSKIIRSVGEHIEGALSLAEMNFIPHAATWLNQERWNDEVSHVRPNTTGANATGNRNGRPSLVEQVRQRGRELEAERSGQAGYGLAPDAELSDPAAYAGIDWDGEFSRIDVTDGSLMGPDD